MTGPYKKILAPSAWNPILFGTCYCTTGTTKQLVPRADRRRGQGDEGQEKQLPLLPLIHGAQCATHRTVAGALCVYFRMHCEGM
eukprot:gene23532-biopygen1267